MIRSLQKRLWALRSLGRLPVLHRASRGLFDLYFRDSVVRRIPFGPLAGMKWHCTTGSQFWMPLGLYEQETTAWIQSHLRPGDVFFDVGANYGYFTLLGSRIVGSGGRVVAFEPVRKCAFAVRRHCELNEITNVDLQEVAVCDEVGEAEFDVESESANSHLGAVELKHAQSKGTEKLRVSTTTLDAIVASTGVRPDVVKIDVEGAEVMVLEGASSLLREAHARLLISTHSDDLKAKCAELISRHPYAVSDLPGFDHELSCTPRKVSR